MVAGDQQPPVVHALAHAINQALGNFDKTVYFTAPIEASPANQWESMQRAGERYARGPASTLLISSAAILPTTRRPIWASRTFCRNVPFSARLGLYEDETSALCHWHIPQTHFLEAWGDARAFDGTVSMIQPLIAPLYDGKSAYEFLALLNGQPAKSNHDIVHDYWQAQQPAHGKRPTHRRRCANSIDTFWKKTLRDGVMAGHALSRRSRCRSSRASPPQPQRRAAGTRNYFSSGSHDLGRPICEQRLAAGIAQAADEAHLGHRGHVQPGNRRSAWDCKSEDTVELKYQGRTIRAPVWVMPGHADESVTVFLGYGRTRSGRVGTGVGFDAGWIRPLAHAVDWLRASKCAKPATRWALADNAAPQHAWKGATWSASRRSTNTARIRHSRKPTCRRIRCRSIRP